MRNKVIKAGDTTKFLIVVKMSAIFILTYSKRKNYYINRF